MCVSPLHCFSAHSRDVYQLSQYKRYSYFHTTEWPLSKVPKRHKVIIKQHPALPQTHPDGSSDSDSDSDSIKSPSISSEDFQHSHGTRTPSPKPLEQEGQGELFCCACMEMSQLVCTPPPYDMADAVHVHIFLCV